MARGGVRGGKRLKRKLRAMRKAGDSLGGTVATVGFHDPHVAQIARLHEFGSKAKDGTRLPERPAFRAALPDMGSAMTLAIKAGGGSGKGTPSPAAIEAGARAAKERLTASYSHAPGPDVGERQAARKAGTPGAGKLLVGSSGPKLIDHLSAEVDANKVD